MDKTSIQRYNTLRIEACEKYEFCQLAARMPPLIAFGGTVSNRPPKEGGLISGPSPY